MSRIIGFIFGYDTANRFGAATVIMLGVLFILVGIGMFLELPLKTVTNNAVYESDFSQWQYIRDAKVIGNEKGKTVVEFYTINSEKQTAIMSGDFSAIYSDAMGYDSLRFIDDEGYHFRRFSNNVTVTKEEMLDWINTNNGSFTAYYNPDDSDDVTLRKTPDWKISENAVITEFGEDYYTLEYDVFKRVITVLPGISTRSERRFNAYTIVTVYYEKDDPSNITREIWNLSELDYLLLGFYLFFGGGFILLGRYMGKALAKRAGDKKQS